MKCDYTRRDCIKRKITQVLEKDLEPKLETMNYSVNFVPVYKTDEYHKGKRTDIVILVAKRHSFKIRYEEIVVMSTFKQKVEKQGLRDSLSSYQKIGVHCLYEFVLPLHKYRMVSSLL